MSILIRNGQIVTPLGSRVADLRIRDEKIVAIGSQLPANGSTVLSAEGKYIFPGFIDTHTHFDLDAGTFRTADDFASGTKAAIAGGTTTILDYATQEKGETLKETLRKWKNMAEGKCFCDYGFHMSITDWNAAVLGELQEMTQEGITSYKLYMAYDSLQVSDGEILEILAAVKKEGGITGVHCENGTLVKKLTEQLKANGETSPCAHPKSRPAEVEAEAVYRLLTIAKLAGAPVNIVHLSTKRAMELVDAARRGGQKVYVETCPQYLLLDESLYHLPYFEGAKYVMSPPLRKKEDLEYLWNALSRNKIDTIGTDHCSFHMKEQKERGKNDFSLIPNGISGVESRGVLVYTYGVGTGRITKEQMCRVLSENPARLFGLYPRKGVLKPGSDADLVIWDPKEEGKITVKEQLQNADYTPYEGMQVKGKPVQVFLRGKKVYDSGKICEESQGIYLHRGKSVL